MILSVQSAVKSEKEKAHSPATLDVDAIWVECKERAVSSAQLSSGFPHSQFIERLIIVNSNDTRLSSDLLFDCTRNSSLYE